jgi:predicted ribosomally synthesized peptide with nif11-like leader
MISEIDRFHTAMNGSPELRQGLQSANNADELVAFAGSNGYNFSVEELEQWGGLTKGHLKGQDELSADDLEKVTAAGAGDVASALYYGGKHVVKAAWNDFKSLFP